MRVLICLSGSVLRALGREVDREGLPLQVRARWGLAVMED